MDNNLFSWIILIGLIGFGIYMMYKGITELMKHTRNRKEYMENHSARYEYFEEYKIWFAGYIIVAVLVFAGGFYQLLDREDLMQAVGYWIICCCMISMALDCLVKRRAWFYEDGFFYEKKFYRYKSVVHIEHQKGLKPGYEVTFGKDPSMIVTKKMAQRLNTEIQNRKKNRKEDRKHGQK